jgi:ferredoxin-NADP reductase
LTVAGPIASLMRAAVSGEPRPRRGRKLGAVFAATAAAILPISFGALPVAAQPAADPHASHHPGGSQAAPAVPSATPVQSPPSGAPTSPGDMTPMMEGMGQMMQGMAGMMGHPPPKQLYPTLMEIPTLGPDDRQRVEHEARTRLERGAAIQAQAQTALQHALATGDAAATARAVEWQREGLALIESGSTVLRALAQGTPPQQTALVWYRQQLGLAPGIGVPSHAAVNAGPFGLSWFHLSVMTALSAFAMAAAAVALAHRRRTTVLLTRLTAAPAAGPSPAPSMPSGRPGPTLATAVQSRALPPARAAKPGFWSGVLRVAAIHRETPHVKTFRLAEPSGGAIPFDFVPGQFLTFSAEIGGKTVRRSYSIASPPTRRAYVEITVKREDGGVFSDHLHDVVAVGDQLTASGPAGMFTFDGGGAESIVLIAGGVGITPLMCVVRYLTDLAWPGDIYLLCAVRNTGEFIFREELEYLQRRCPNLHVAAAMMERSEGTSWMGPEGYLTRSIIEAAVPEIPRRRVHLCGPPTMMEAIRRILAEIGVPQSQIKTEAFGPATGAMPPPDATVVTPPQRIVALLRDVEREANVAAEAEQVVGPATAFVRFARSAKSAPLPPDRTILEVAEAIGVPIDYSCRVGTCGVCKVRLTDGQVTMEVDEALTPDDKSQGIVLACQAKSVGNLTVDA